MSEFGYGKPPRHSQFQKGKSGNPKGRPRGRPEDRMNMANIFARISAEKMTVRDGEKIMRMRKDEALLRSQYHDALADKGTNRRDLLSLMKEQGMLMPAPDPNAPQTGVLLAPQRLDVDEWQKLSREAHNDQRRSRDSGSK